MAFLSAPSTLEITLDSLSFYFFLFGFQPAFLSKKPARLFMASSALAPTLSNPMDRSLPGSSVHEIFQARVLEWGAVAFSACKAKGTLFSVLW